MTELKPLLETIRDSVEPPGEAFGRLNARRRARRRRQRVTVGALSLVVAAAGVALVVRAFPGLEAPSREAGVPPEAVAFVVRSDGPDEIYLLDLATGSKTRVSEGRDSSWSPDGGLLAYRTGTPGYPTEIHVTEVGGEPRRIFTVPSSDPAGGPVAWSPDGTRIAFDTYDGIYVANADGTEAVRVSRYEGESPCYDLQPDWSPDGAQLVFALRCDGADRGLFVVNVDGSGRTAITGGNAGPAPEWSDRSPVWSPDGTKIAFIRAPQSPEGDEYAPDVYVMNADGSGVTRITHDGRFEDRPEWSVDGRHLLISDFDGRLYSVALDRSDMTLLGETGGCCPAWRPTSGNEPLPQETTESDEGPLAPEVTAKIPVSAPGYSAGGVAAGFGAIWVGGVHGTGEFTVARIAPETNEIVARIPTGGVSQVAAGAGGVWIAGEELGLQIQRIDPTTNEVVAAIPGAGAPLAATSDALWASGRRLGEDPPGSVVKIDPQTNAVVDEIEIPVSPLDIEVGEGAVWVLGYNGGVVRVDIDTGLVEQIDIDPHGHEIAVGAGYVWVPGWLHDFADVGTGSGDRTVIARIDAGTGQVLEDPLATASFRPFDVGEGGVWFLGRKGICRLSLDDLEQDSCVEVPTARPAMDSAVLDESTGTIWLANYERTVTRIDLRPAPGP
ncbi:MAG: hypothetical protein ABR518_03545 [Actinomycetota bacterium]